MAVAIEVRPNRFLVSDRSLLVHLHDKLVRESTQAEHDAVIHGKREAHRQGPGAPADALLAIAAHAETIEAQLRAVTAANQPFGTAVALVVAKIFSNVREHVVDHVLAHERTYRATLLGMRHGLDAAILLRDVAGEAGRSELHDVLDAMVPRRSELLDDAVEALGWFAMYPRRATCHS
jgi:hypothetical protein